MFRARSIVLTMSTFLCCTWTASGADNAKITLEDIADKLKARDQALMSLELHATIIGIDDAGNPKPNWATVEFDYAETSDGKREHREIRTNVRGEKSVRWIRTDGQCEYIMTCPPNSTETVKHVLIRKSDNTPSRNNMGMNEILTLLGPRGLRLSEYAKTATDLHETPRDDGDSDLAVNFHDGFAIPMILSAHHGFMPREAFAGSNSRTYVTKYRNVDGFWFPVEGVDHGIAVGGEPYRTKFVVDRIRVNFEPTASRFGMPALVRGSTVMDETRKYPPDYVHGVDPDQANGRKAAQDDFISRYGKADPQRGFAQIRQANDPAPVTGKGSALFEPTSANIVTSLDRPREQVSFDIRNVGDKAFEIRKIWGSPGIEIVSYEPNSVPPGKKAVVKLEIRPGEAYSHHPQLNISTDIPDQLGLTYPITLSGPALLPNISHVSPSIAFGQVRGTGAECNFTVYTNELFESKPWLDSIGCTLDGVTIQSSLANSRLHSDQITVSRIYHCVARIDQPMPPGEHAGRLQWPVLGNSDKRAANYPVTVTVLPAIEARPASIFGDFSKFTDIPAFEIELKNRSGMNGAKFEPIVPVAKGISVEKISQSMESAKFRIRLTEPFGKRMRSEIAFRTAIEEQPEIRIPVRLEIQE